MAAPLYLLHPFPVDSGFWEPVRALLPAGRRVVAPDFPGFGMAPAAAAWQIDQAAERIAARIAAEPGGRAVVCGLSMGGYAALALAAGRPAVLAGLILADTRAEADDRAALDGRREGARTVRERGLPAFLDALLPRLVADPAALAAVRPLAERQSPDAVVAALAALGSRPDRRDRLAAVVAPTLVIVGERDGPTPEAAARVLADGIPGAELAVIAGAGHLSAIERPREFAALISGALERWGV